MDVLAAPVSFSHHPGMLFGLLWLGNRKSRLFISYLPDMGRHDTRITSRLFSKVHRVGSCLDLDVLLVVT